MICTLTKARTRYSATIHGARPQTCVQKSSLTGRMQHLPIYFRTSRRNASMAKKNLPGVEDTVAVVCLLSMRGRGQTTQTILPLRHAVQWRLCLGHVPPDKAPSSPDICQPSPRCFLPTPGRKAGSLARWCVTTKVDVAPLRCHMPPDGGEGGGGITSPAQTPTVRLM